MDISSTGDIIVCDKIKHILEKYKEVSIRIILTTTTRLELKKFNLGPKYCVQSIRPHPYCDDTLLCCDTVHSIMYKNIVDILQD